MTITSASPTLAQYSKKIKAAMHDADTGPLVIAKDVLELAANWTAFKKEAKGLKVTAWLTREFGNKQRNLAYFKRRQDAVDALGEDIRRTFHHEVAVYVINNVPSIQLQEVKDALTKAYIRNGHNPLAPQQAIPIIHTVIGKPLARKRHCPGCRCHDDAQTNT